MIDLAERPRTEGLARNLPWTRQVAEALVRNALEADDLAQDALIVAARMAPPEEGTLRPWLRGVLRNLARMRHRSARRRSIIEAQAGVGTGCIARLACLACRATPTWLVSLTWNCA